MQNQENFNQNLNDHLQTDRSSNQENSSNSYADTKSNVELETDTLDESTSDQSLISQLAELQQELQNTQHSFLLARADLENQKKRHQDELEKTKKFAIEGFASQMLSVMDALSAALADNTGNAENLKKGVELTYKQLQSCFERFKINEVDALGHVFDPALHQVISTQPSSEAPHTILQVLQKGYKIQERLLRPAMVITAISAE